MCPVCGWRGRASDELEIYPEVADVTCPSCDKMIVILQFPTIDEVKQAAAEGNPKAQRELGHYLSIERNWERFEVLRLKDASELPERQGDPLAFDWDFEEDRPAEAGGDSWTVIRCGSREVWREPAVYEGAERFDEVKELINTRYGRRFATLTPTSASGYYLYGDRSRGVSTT